MKPIVPVVLILFTVAIHSNAQTNTTPIPRTSTDIFADQGEFVDLKTNIVVAVYRGNVQVEDPKMRMTCELLTARIPNLGGRIESIVAERKVVIDMIDERGQKIHGTGDKAIYTCNATAAGTNEIVELTGNPMLETAQGTLTGDIITYDRITGRLKATNQRMVVRADLAATTNVVSPTNVPANANIAPSGGAVTNAVTESTPADQPPSQ
jgi:lipopolysaccharide transport protein LptA